GLLTLERRSERLAGPQRARLGNEGAPTRAGLDEPFADQGADRLTDRSDAHVEDRRQIAMAGKLLSRGEFPGRYLPAELIGDGHRQIRPANRFERACSRCRRRLVHVAQRAPGVRMSSTIRRGPRGADPGLAEALHSIYAGKAPCQSSYRCVAVIRTIRVPPGAAQN